MRTDFRRTARSLSFISRFRSAVAGKADRRSSRDG
jgi:hypothetical protein